MSYKRIERWPHAKMIRTRYNGHYTICAKLKKLYQDTNDEYLKEELAICVAMAKKMHEKLKYYKRKEVQNEHQSPTDGTNTILSDPGR